MDFQKSLLSCIILSGVYISASHAQTLQEAIQLTINENPEIQEARALRLAYEQDINQAKAGEEFGVLFAPQLDFNVGDVIISVRR